MTGWVSGDNGLIRATTNGGATWFAQASGTTHNLTDIYFLNSSTGWIIGIEVVLYTTNGGANWASITSYQHQFAACQFFNAQTGYSIVGDGYIAKTTTGGVDWVEHSTGTSTILLDIFFTDEATGWVSGLDGIIRRTTNNGVNWVNQEISGAPHITSLYFFNANTGWAAGGDGKLYKTTNGGTNWATVSTGHSHFIARIFFRDINTGWMSTDNGRMYITTNAGINWNQQVTGFGSAAIMNLSFINKSTGWACMGDGKILATTTGGFAVGMPVLNSPANGSVAPLAPTMNYNGVQNASGYHIQIATDSNFSSLIINDTSLAVSPYQTPSGVLQPGTKYYWRMRAKHNSGAGLFTDVWSFTTIAVPSVPNLIAPANNSIGQSVNPPLDWDSAGIITTFRAQVSTDSLFTAANFDTTISRSNITVPNGRLFANTKYYWRVMASGPAGSSAWSTVWNFRTMVTGAVQTGSGIPFEFKLYSNYPNPFNPVTKITYDLPEGSNVKLVVYDMLGKEVTKLVNEFKPAGSYSIQFNAEGLTSGVYFYRIETRSFKDTKRMLLLK
jgi:photosystem II stability/assembly factor-like uncharacterized protein